MIRSITSNGRSSEATGASYFGRLRGFGLGRTSWLRTSVFSSLISAGRASTVTGYLDVRAEMAHYIDALKVDGVITDNPDQMPGRAPKR